MLVSYGCKLHITPTNCHLLAAQQLQYKEAYLLTKNVEEVSWNNSGEWTIRRKMTRQKEQEN